MKELTMKKARGLSLVELMVALVLGSIIVAAATQLFLVNQQTNNLQNGLAHVQDQGRFAFSYISRDLMQAGYSDAGTKLVPFAVSATSIPGGEVISNNDTNDGDVLVLQIEGGRNCVGNIITGRGQKEYLLNNERGLLCRTRYFDAADNAWKTDSEVIVDGVEAFEVQYGIDTDSLGDSGYGAADFYATANTVVASDRIVSVRYALLLTSDRVVSRDSSYAPSSIRVLDAVYDSDAIDFTDGKAYRVYTSTVEIRNQI